REMVGQPQQPADLSMQAPHPDKGREQHADKPPPREESQNAPEQRPPESAHHTAEVTLQRGHRHDHHKILNHQSNTSAQTHHSSQQVQYVADDHPQTLFAINTFHSASGSLMRL